MAKLIPRSTPIIPILGMVSQDVLEAVVAEVLQRCRTAQLIERVTIVRPASITYLVSGKKVEHVPPVSSAIKIMFLLQYNGG